MQDFSRGFLPLKFQFPHEKNRLIMLWAFLELADCYVSPDPPPVLAISWCNVTEQPLDVTANGYKHGVTKKVLGTAKARWSHHTLLLNPPLIVKFHGNSHPDTRHHYIQTDVYLTAIFVHFQILAVQTGVVPFLSVSGILH